MRKQILYFLFLPSPVTSSVVLEIISKVEKQNIELFSKLHQVSTVVDK